MNLRPYQREAVDGILESVAEHRNSLAVLPTGGGKTIIFSHVAKAMLPKRTLILAHREELIDQAIAKLHAATGLFADKEKAEARASMNADIVVASIQTLAGKKRLRRWPRNHFGLVIADEAHHSIAASWQKVLNYFDAPVLGVTATADRGDKKNLGSFYENIAYEISLLDLIDQGYLSPIHVTAAPIEIDLANVKQTTGDFDAAGVASALDPFLPSIAAELKRLAPHRKILAFLPLRVTSKKFVQCCKDAGFKAAHIDGTSKNRKEILEAYERDEFQILSNAMLLTEGYDCPDIDCVVVLRPTRSRPLYCQMVGRGTRIDPFKDNLLLIDFLWAHERHNLIRPACLTAETDEMAKTMTAVVEREAKGGAQGELDLKELASDATMEREKKLAEEIAKNSKRKAEDKNMMEFCLSLHRADLADWQPTMKQDQLPITDPQRAALERAGVEIDGVRGRGHASALLDMIAGRTSRGFATPKQVRLMTRLGHPNAATASFEEAGAWIGRRLGGARQKRTRPQNKRTFSVAK